MSTITLPNIRVSSDLTIRLKLKDGGVAIDWSTLQNIRVSLYADDQRSMASRCSVSIDEEDSTILVCQYAANKMQYLGVNRVIVQCKYMGEVKTYDKPAFNFVRWTSDQEGEQITIDDPDVDVEISVEDVSSSILQEAVDAAFSAADRANEAAEEAEHMVDIHTGPAGKSPYIGENGHWYEWDEETHQYVDTETNAKGDTGETPDISIGTVTTVEPGTPAAASMGGTPEAPVLNLSIPKGAVGATPNFTVGTVTTGQPGTPVVITITGTAEAPVLNVTIPQGLKGDTGVSADYPITIHNGLDSDATDEALAAFQGKVLDGKVSQLEAEVTELEKAINGGTDFDNIVVGSGGMMTFDPVTLSQDGDSLEIEALFSGSLNYNQGYAFAGYGSAIAIDLEPTIFGVKNASGVWLDGMNGGNNQYQTGVRLYEGKNIRLVYEESKIRLYVDGTSVHEVSTQSAVTIDRVCYERQSGGQSYYWEGTIRKFNYTHNGITKNITQFENFATTGDITINTSSDVGLRNRVGALESAQAVLSANVDELKGEEQYVNLVKDLGWGVKFNGTNAFCSLKQDIVLSQEGDSIEFDLVVNETVQTDGYAFCTGGRPNGLGMGITMTTLEQISDDGTWLCELYNLGASQHQNIKVEFADGKMKYYRNGTLVNTYNGQKSITFKKFGVGRDIYGYWDGIINSVKVNGSNYDLSENSVFTNAELYRENGFLEPWQVASSLPEIVVSPIDTTHFLVKVLDSGNGKYLLHTFERSQGSRTINGVSYNSLDVWHTPEVLDENGGVLFQGNLNFIYCIGKVNGVSSSDASVNENCHIGPSHGCEVMQFCKFFTDGKEFDPATATEDVKCSVFRMVMKSTCYVGDSSYSTGNVNNYPKIVNGAMVEHAIHYLDATYRVNNDIKWTNRLAQVRDASVQYEMLAGGMAQANLSYVGDLMLNDIENSWNEIVPGTSSPVYSAPSGYNSVILHGTYRRADSVIEYGDNCLLKQKMVNMDNSKQDHIFIHTWSNNNASFKCYLMAARVTEQTDPDTFTEGDVVDVTCERQIEVS